MDTEDSTPRKYLEPLWQETKKDIPPQVVLFRYIMRALINLNISIKDLQILDEESIKTYAHSSSRQYLKYHQYNSGICEGLTQVSGHLMATGRCSDWVVFINVCKRIGAPNIEGPQLSAEEDIIFRKYSKIIMQCQFGINLSVDDADTMLKRIILTQKVQKDYYNRHVDTDVIGLLRKVSEFGTHYDKAKCLAFLLNDIDLPKTNLFMGNAQLRVKEAPECTRIRNNRETIADWAKRFEASASLFTPPNRVAVQTKNHTAGILSLPHIDASGRVYYKWAIYTPNYGGTIVEADTKLKKSGYGLFRLFSGAGGYLWSKPKKELYDPLTLPGYRIFSNVSDAIIALFDEHEFDQDFTTYSVNLGGCGPQWRYGQASINLTGPIRENNSISIGMSLIDFVEYMNQPSALVWQSLAQSINKGIDSYRVLSYSGFSINIGMQVDMKQDIMSARTPRLSARY